MIENEDDLPEQPFDASDPKQVNEKRKKSGRLKKQQREFISDLMDKPEGRRWIYDLLSFCHVGSTRMIERDPYATHYELGETNVGNYIYNQIIQSAPEQFVVMLREAKLIPNI